MDIFEITDLLNKPELQIEAFQQENICFQNKKITNFLIFGGVIAVIAVVGGAICYNYYIKKKAKENLITNN